MILTVKFRTYLKDIARRSRPALSLSKSALMMSPVDLFSCFEAFRSRLASAYCGDLDMDLDRYDELPLFPGSALPLPDLIP